jgi:hypothetical protein
VGCPGENIGAYRVWVRKRAASKLTNVGVDIDWMDLAQNRKIGRLWLQNLWRISWLIEGISY